MAKKILIVDDDADVRDTIEVLLKAEGYEVVVAHDGEAALTAAEAERPDLILLDRVMPNMGGLEVIQTLRARPSFANTIMVLLTARADLSDMRQGWDAGSDLYLTKPFAPADLVANIKEILGSPRPSRVD